MSVFHAETDEQNFRVAVGYVIAISVGIKKQIGHLQNKHTAVSERDSRCQV